MAEDTEVFLSKETAGADQLVIMDDIDRTQAFETGRIEEDGTLKLSPRLRRHLGVDSKSTSLRSFTTPRGILLTSQETFLDVPADRLRNRRIRDLTREELVETGCETRRQLVDKMDASHAGAQQEETSPSPAG